MTSPDGAAPPGTFPAQLLNTLQEVQACGVGKEGKLLIQALAAFGDGITREFYHGFTNVVDAVQAGFDALGEALSGEPGMGGILGFASDIQGTLLGAIELSEVLLGDVTEILKQLALGLGCNDVSGPIAENIGGALRDALNKLTAVMRMLFTLIEVIVGVPGATMEDLAAFLSGKWEAIGAVSALAQRIRDAIFGAFDFLPSGDDEADLLGALMAIPQGNVSGLTDAFAGLRGVAQDAVDTAENAIDTAAQLIIDGLANSGPKKDPIQNALKSFIDLIFGSGTSTGSTVVVRWVQEVLLCAGPVVTGTNDLPLGFQSPYPATITSINMRTSEHLSTGAGSRVVVQTLKNGNVIHTATWNGGVAAYSSGALSISGINANDVITFNVTEASSQMANMSITVAGRYS